MVILLRKIMLVSQFRNMEVKTKELDLEELIIKNLESIKKIINVDDVEIKLDVKAAVLNSDQEVISNILYNIILNAITYASFAGTHSKKWIEIHTYKNRNSIFIEVSNNGVTIPKESDDRIYEMFYKANDINNGYGLGLYISKIAIENIGGKISHHSKNDEVTTFRIEIPEVN